jgi:alpha-galactosidase/6-phospho-beta-glucosidase family protein
MSESAAPELHEPHEHPDGVAVHRKPETKSVGLCHSVPYTAVQNLTVRAALEGRQDYVYHAAMLDRHAASVLSLDEIAEMVDELIDAHGESLPEGVRV